MALSPRPRSQNIRLGPRLDGNARPPPFPHISPPLKRFDAASRIIGAFRGSLVPAPTDPTAVHTLLPRRRDAPIDYRSRSQRLRALPPIQHLDQAT